MQADRVVPRDRLVHTGDQRDPDRNEANGASRRQARRDAARGSRQAHLSAGPLGLHRRAAVRARAEVHLRGQLGLPRAREPDPERQRLPDGLHRPPAGGHHAQQGRQAQRAGQYLHAPRRDPVPIQEGQPVELHLPVPRLDLQQHRQAAQGQGPIARRRLPAELQLRRQPRSRASSAPSRAIAASCSAASTRTCCR